MGAANAMSCYVHWYRLPDVPFRLLVGMALVALDSDAEPTFYGGREAQARYIGRDVPPEPPAWDKGARAEAERRARHAAFVAVGTAIRKLQQVGAIRRLRSGRPGRNAEYLLCLAPADAAEKPIGDESTKQGEPASQSRVSLSMGQGDPAIGTGSPWPRRGQEDEEHTEDNRSPRVPTSPAAAITYAEASSILGRLPDLGGALLARVADTAGASIPDRAIAAATLHLAESATAREHLDQIRRTS